ncbi:MAG: endolytic transglycosylase MltG [Burkholderiales bacterium]|nr:endolytic transglycosylase MltG [Burkholderiales bacterium]
MEDFNKEDKIQDFGALGHSMSKFGNNKFLQKKILFYFLLFIVFLLFIYVLFFSVPKDFPVGKIINIKEGSSLRSLSRDLEKNNIIKSRAIFETFVIIFDGEKHIESGDYMFEDRLFVFEIAKRIANGEHNLLPVKVTVPEGFNLMEISKLFDTKLPNFDKDKFLTKAREGYLFPDTYFFLTTDTEEEVIEYMSNNFQKKIALFKSKIDISKKTEKDIITMASILEKESKGDEDRKLISGILWKRISIGMPLQVDAEPSTYKTKGLPSSPISNPGIEAIEAAINPMNSSYLYYLHGKEGQVHFARTFEEHKINKQKYLK